jgi:DNA-binding NarL/FixJ family response regulator
VFDAALVIDEDERVAQTLQSVGLRHVRWVTGLEQGLASCERAPDLLVVEVTQRTGAQNIFTESRLRGVHTIVVATSATATRAQVFALHDYGVACFWDKPVCPQLVQMSLSSLSQRREHQKPAALAQRADRRVAQLRERFGLTAAESEILSYALLRLTYDEMADRRAVSRNTIKSQVRSLLGKLELTSLRDVASCLSPLATRGHRL